jgi:hypothetical protein
MSKQSPRLPVLHNPAPKPDTFPVGSRVLLRSTPVGAPGTVTGTQRGRIHVRWADLDFVGKHRPSTLIVVGQPIAAEAQL